MSYKFAEVPLSPAVFAALATELIEPGRTVSRKDLIEKVSSEHEARGGLPARGVVVGAAKKALQALAADGRVEPIAQGYWRFVEPMTPDSITEPVEVGSGDEAVYVYYFPAYRDQAAHLNRDSWPMKIGMTTTPDVSVRIKDQCGTAMPEAPIVGLIYRTGRARNAERMLHSVLQERGRRLSDAPGKEWFLTSLSEVRGVLDFVTKSG